MSKHILSALAATVVLIAAALIAAAAHWLASALGAALLLTLCGACLWLAVYILALAVRDEITEMPKF